MTDRSKFEQMLEHLVNEEQELAKELFHEIVVEKSRQIYENILSEDFNEAKDEDDEDEEVDEATEADDDEEVEENFSFEGDDIGGDPTDDMADELEMDDEDDMGMDDEDMGMDDEEESSDMEDRVVDLEDAIDDLRAEFEKMMGDEDDMGSDDMGSDDMGMDDEDEMASYESDNFMREYIEKVGSAKMGDNGANAKSIVASKNNMGGTSANIVKGGTESESASTKGGLAAPTPKDMSTGNINVPGGNAGKTAFRKKEPGHGAEKKGAAESSDKSAGSPLNGAPRRAK